MTVLAIVQIALAGGAAVLFFLGTQRVVLYSVGQVLGTLGAPTRDDSLLHQALALYAGAALLTMIGARAR